MSANENPDLTPADLAVLRSRPDALRYITERLRVKEMGPADHIRTKHEVKAYLNAPADATEAEAIIERAQVRRAEQQARALKMNMSERQGRRISE